MASAISPLHFAATGFDYLIAGGGTAGLTLATRLTEDSKVTVGVIEAGIDRSTDPKVLTPGLATSLWDDPDYTWMFKTTPQVYELFLSVLSGFSSDKFQLGRGSKGSSYGQNTLLIQEISLFWSPKVTHEALTVAEISNIS